MQTFRNDYVLTGIPNAEIYQQLVDYAKSKGVPVYKETVKEEYPRWPNLAFVSSELFSSELCGNCGVEGKEIITFEQFFQYCDNWSKCQPVTVKLNDDYTAKIEGNTVKVGCQTFEFEAIERMYNAMKKTAIERMYNAMKKTAIERMYNAMKKTP